MKILLQSLLKVAFIAMLMFSCFYKSSGLSSAAFADFSAPTATTISAPVYANFYINSDKKMVIVGRADPFSQVDLVAGSKLLGQAWANHDGDFQISFLTKLRLGEYRYVLRSTNNAGHSATSEQTLIVNVSDDKKTPFTAIIEDLGGSQHIVYPSPQISIDDSKNDKDIFGIEYIFYNYGHFIVCGHAPANRRVAFYHLDFIVGSEFIKQTGRFCIERSNKFAEGTYAFKAQLLDEKGKIFDNITLPFTISNGNHKNEQYYIANKPVETVVVRQGETLSQIAQRVYGDYNLANQIYQFNRHKLNNIYNIEAGQRLALPPKP